MAKRDRHSDDEAAEERIDDVFDDAVDDDASDDDDDAFAEEKPSKRGGGAALKTRTKPEKERAGVFGRVGRFFREVVAELRKVIWPTRKELVTYTVVVVVFVAAITAIVVGFDYVYAKGVLFVFGNPKQ